MNMNRIICSRTIVTGPINRLFTKKTLFCKSQFISTRSTANFIIMGILLATSYTIFILIYRINLNIIDNHHENCFCKLQYICH